MGPEIGVTQSLHWRYEGIVECEDRTCGRACVHGWRTGRAAFLRAGRWAAPGGWRVGGVEWGLWIGGAKAKAKGCGVRTGAIAQKGGCAWEADGRRLGGDVEEAGSAWGGYASVCIR